MKLVIRSVGGNKLSLDFPKELELKDFSKLFSVVDYPRYYGCIKNFCNIDNITTKKSVFIYDDSNNIRFKSDDLWYNNTMHYLVYDFYKVR